MTKNWWTLVIFTSLLLASCHGETKVVFSDALLKQYPSDPIVFQKKFGGDLVYYQGNALIKEKGANTDKALLSGEGFVISFWRAKDFYIHHIKLTKNKIKIGNVDVIGKNVNEITRIFGNPEITSEGALNYSGENTVLTLGVEEGIITSCYWGFEI